MKNQILIAAMASTMLFAAPVEAQSTGQFTKVENRNCKVWNPAPAPNETVYWTGKCKAGYGEGRGIISYGTIIDGRPQVSISKVVLEGGRQTGYGEYYSRTGNNTKREYENGKMKQSMALDSLTSEATDMAIENDLDSKIFPDGMVGHINLFRLNELIKNADMTVIDSRMIGGRPFANVKDSKGAKFTAAGGACRNGMCSGLLLMSEHMSSIDVNPDDLNRFNVARAVAKLTISATDPKTYSAARYLILDGGVASHNILTELKTFANVSALAAKELGGTQE
jgi:hypothetical protein